ncbi:hypothetical protein L6164_009024 [Bauhinia variegata]|uniref:Uncharacterized protein n=1 Tax=Bauhinia variegata TaxID=167791 RepID=A0ACB9PII4_BAUVA|nr:hypothetical protein L6164_009024 [Bauhinia variegata]
MFSSQTLVSSKGPLGAIWVAAYCLKRLKKSQVKETDISTSVDKILQEINAVTYRILAYLLLGVVRIYSKKVEYLFDDCNEVLSAIKKFVVNTQNNARMELETLRMHITLPDKFELDAFDLDILEDVAIGNVASREEITLKDVFWKDEGIARFYLDEYLSEEEFETCPNTCTTDNPMAEDTIQFHLMDNDFNSSAPNRLINSQAGREKSHNTVFPQQEPMDLDTDLVDREPKNPANDLCREEQHINEEEITIQETEQFEDEMCLRSIEKICRLYQEESVETSMLHGGEQEPVVLDETFVESDLVDEEQIMATEMAMSENRMQMEIGAVHEASNSQVSTEGLQDTLKEQSMDHDKFSAAELGEHIDGSFEEHQNKDKLDSKGKVSAEEGNFQAIGPESINLDGTPESKFPDASDARPKAGATTPDFMLIPTPSAAEPARFSRKRKCIWDKNVVFSNEVLRHWIRKSSDLIRRRKSLHNLSAARRASRISSLPEGFSESLLPCHSLELQSLFSKNKMKIESLENMETPGSLDEADTQTVGRAVETPECFDVSEAQVVGMPEPVDTAPKTPPLSSTIRSFESPESPQIANFNMSPSNPQERIEKVQTLHKDEKLNLMKECNVKTSSYEEHSLERDEELTRMNECNVRTSSSYEEHSLEKDEELTLMNEEINSCETDNQEMFGWSGRTMQVGRFLHKIFQNIKGKDLNLSQVLGKRTRKDCAKLFYETLVLKSTSCVDVKQDNAYGDILLWKLPKLDQTFGVHGDS